MNAETFWDVYLAGLVKRHHANPSDVTQTIGHHSWGVAMILLWIWPDATRAAIVAALRHDVGEYWTGDMPAHVKWANRRLSDELEVVENRVMRTLGFDDDLSEEEARAVKCADMLELLLFSVYRQRLGDQFFNIVVNRIIKWFHEHPKFVFNLKVSEAISHVLNAPAHANPA